MKGTQVADGFVSPFSSATIWETMNDLNYSLDLEPNYGVAGFEEMVDALATANIPQKIVKYILVGILSAREHSPVVASKLVADVREHFGYRITDATVRKIVSAARVDKRWPIASCGKGYYLATRASQLESTIEHLNRRVNREVAVVGELKQVQRMMKDRESTFERK